MIKDLLLIHGWASNKDIFRPVEVSLKKIGFNVRYLDYANLLPIYENFERIMLDVIYENKCIPLGWSMGGMLLIQFMNKYPLAFDKVILSSTCLTRPNPLDVLQKMSLGIQSNKTKELKRFYSLSIFNKRNYKFANLEPDPNIFSDSWLYAGLDYLDKVNLIEEAKNIKSEVTIIHGMQDRIVNFELALQMSSVISDAEFIYFEESGHIPFLEEPDKFINVVVDVFNENKI